MTTRPQNPDQPPVYGLHHAAYRCSDAEQTRQFYEDKIGFPMSMALHIDFHPVTGEECKYLHVFFDISSHSDDDTQSNYIAFFEVPDHPGDDPEKLFKKNRDGFDLHFSMAVKDHDTLSAWHERLTGNGLEVIGPVRHGICSSIYFHDPDGYLLEFTAEDEAEQAEFDQHGRDARKHLAEWNARKAKLRAAAKPELAEA